LTARAGLAIGKSAILCVSSAITVRRRCRTSDLGPVTIEGAMAADAEREAPAEADDSDLPSGLFREEALASRSAVRYGELLALELRWIDRLPYVLVIGVLLGIGALALVPVSSRVVLEGTTRTTARTVEVLATVPVDVSSELAPGLSASFITDGSTATEVATVVTVGAATDAASCAGATVVVARINDPTSTIKDGQRGTLSIRLAPRPLGSRLYAGMVAP
jgi:hypothetical protein